MIALATGGRHISIVVLLRDHVLLRPVPDACQRHHSFLSFLLPCAQPRALPESRE